MITKVESIKHFDELLEKHSKLVLDFGATWCGPCQKIAPLVHDLAIKFPDIVFLTIDVDDHEDIQTRYPEISQLPFFIFVHNKKTLADLKCVGTRELIERSLTKLGSI